MPMIVDYIRETRHILDGLQLWQIDAVKKTLRETPNRLFIIGLGGSAAHASHAVNDFRKIAGMDAQSPLDNVAELTARINDDGWDTCISEWLQGSDLTHEDTLLVISVGGGSDTVSQPLVRAMEVAAVYQMPIVAITGMNGGYAARYAKGGWVCIPSDETPHVEGITSVILHALVST
jgi:D-sedoheptulose 7-phosphate isomerase